MSETGQQLSVESLSPIQQQLSIVDDRLESALNKLLSLTNRLKCICQPMNDAPEQPSTKPEECVPMLNQLGKIEGKIDIFNSELDSLLTRLQL